MASSFKIIQAGKITFFKLSFNYFNTPVKFSVYSGSSYKSEVSSDGKTITWELPDDENIINITNFISTDAWGGLFQYGIQLDNPTTLPKVERTSNCDIDVLQNDEIKVTVKSTNYSGTISFNINVNGKTIKIVLFIG